ncbi:MAG: permease-like cell division protein FtsX [Patescibacteria group bacterium]
MFTTAQRVIKHGFQHVWRNTWLSAATILVMVLALSMVLGLLLLSVLTEAVIVNLENKVDVSAYFVSGTPEEEIQSIRNELAARSDVRSVVYVSENEALERFRERHKEDPIVAQVLEELGENPLEASLNIKAKDPEQFAAIVRSLESEQYASIMSKVNFYENQSVITALTSVTSAIRKIGFFLSAVLSVIAVLVSFNTIHMAIYTLREEVGIMKLVGATNWFVRGPFLAAGAFYGLAASVVTIALFYPFVTLVGPYVGGFFPGADLLAYYQVNFFLLWLIVFVIGVALGVIGSFVAIRKYLKI